MFAYVSYRSPDMPPIRSIGGARFHAVYVAEGDSVRAKLSARAAARALRRAGVRSAVFPPDYPYRSIFARFGVLAPSLAPLYRATAAQIVRRYMEQRGIVPRSATIVFAASAVTPELRRCVESLCADVRYITLAVPRGGNALADALRREFGVAAHPGTPDTAAGLTVVFDDIPTVGNVLRLDEALRVSYDNAPSTELLAALWRMGAFHAASARVLAVDPPSPPERP